MNNQISKFSAKSPTDVLNELEDRVLFIVMIVSFPAIFITAYRMFIFGLSLTNIVHLTLGFVLVFAYFLKPYLKQNIRIFFPIIVGYLYGLMSFFILGILSSGLLLMLTVSIVLSIMEKTKLFVIINSLNLLILILIAYLNLNGYATIKVNVEEYFNSWYSWTLSIISWFIYIIVIFYLLFNFRRTWVLSHESLYQSQSELTSIINNTPDLIYRINLNGEIIFVNDVILKYGYSKDDIIGTLFTNYLHPDDIDLAVERFSKNTTSTEYELSASNLKFKTKDGSFRTFEIISSPVLKWIQNVPTIYGIQAIARDLTDYYKIQEDNLKLASQIQHKQKLEALGLLAGGIAHDFNNILAGMFGYIHLIKLHSNDDKKLIDYSDSLLQAGLRAKDLIAQILTFSNSTHSEKKLISPNTIIKEINNLFSATLPKGILLKLDLNNDDVVINANPTKIHQVLINLVTNSVHAIEPNSGEIIIKTGIINILKQKLIFNQIISQGKYFKITVEDNGSGISNDILSKIFDPYFTTKAQGKGSGLGLSTVLGIINEHNAYIDVSSQLNIGTKFSIYFPIIEKSIENQQSSSEKMNTNYNSIKILFVDDETAITETSKIVLETLDFHVTTFNNPKKALEHFKNNVDAYDLVLSDSNMPEMSGIEFLQIIRSLNSNLHLALMSGNTSGNNFVNIDGLKISIIVNKPIIYNELANLIRNIFNN